MLLCDYPEFTPTKHHLVTNTIPWHSPSNDGSSLINPSYLTTSSSFSFKTDEPLCDNQHGKAWDTKVKRCTNINYCNAISSVDVSLDGVLLCEQVSTVTWP